MYTEVYEQLTTSIETTAAQSFAFDYWSGGGDLKNLADLKQELEECLKSSNTAARDSSDVNNVGDTLAKIANHLETETKLAGDKNVWQLPLEERISLLSTWKEEIDREALVKQVTTLHFDLQRANRRIKGIHQRLDQQVLKKQNVIGLTTTACASNWMLLKNLELEVVICEEAAEVLEAHTLCTLLPSIEHAIFIGDPLQLRPEVDQPILSLETRLGFDYRLDESLFERCMNPKDPSLPPMPTSHLSVQRRMHPEISCLSKLTYPYLLDHSQTWKNPTTIGIIDRVYWVDHEQPETCPNEATKSYSNNYEVDMVTRFVQYLLRNNGYSLGDIAVLTPYNGQLAALNQALKSTCNIWLSEKDRQALLEDGLLEEKDAGPFDDKEKVRMGDMLRVATIDNFQGDEAKIVILSTVRSGGGTGFLRTHNRINVACSRARDGFYIIGNSSTLQTVPAWRHIIDILVMNGKIGYSFRLGCTIHMKQVYHISKPGDFDLVRPCQVSCTGRLPCKHSCKENCHPLSLHAIFKCHEPCSKTLDCGHACQKECHEDCQACTYRIGTQKLSCGHTVDVICPDIVQECQEIIEELKLPCGHTKTLRCSEIDNIYDCEAECSKPLLCGHLCRNICSNCSNGNHPPCSTPCGKVLSCGHKCDTECHSLVSFDTPCPACQQPCRRSCSHGHCQNPCSMICDPCVKFHESTCTHKNKSAVICSLPPEHMPCNEPCTRVLNCGHLCPSLCGEICLEGCCPECTTGLFPSKFVMLIPECGHIFEVEELDARVLRGPSSVSPNGRVLEIPLGAAPAEAPTCFCGGSLQKVNRYAVLIQGGQILQTIDRLIAKIGRRLEILGSRLRAAEYNLLESWTSFRESIRPNPLAARENLRIIGERTAGLLDLKKDASSFRGEQFERRENQC